MKEPHSNLLLKYEFEQCHKEGGLSLQPSEGCDQTAFLYSLFRPFTELYIYIAKDPSCPHGDVRGAKISCRFVQSYPVVVHHASPHVGAQSLFDQEQDSESHQLDLRSFYGTEIPIPLSVMVSNSFVYSSYEFLKREIKT